MTKFKAGDKVIRTEKYDAGGDFDFMFKGRECVVSHCPDAHLVNVEGSNMSYDIRLFTLVQPTFKNMKFRVSTSEHSKEIQEALFEMGYKWNGHHKQSLLEYPNYSYIYTDEEGIILYGSWEPTFVQDLSEEYTLEIIKSYKIVPAEIEKLETITIDGKTYDKEAVLKRLAELEEVK